MNILFIMTLAALSVTSLPAQEAPLKVLNDAEAIMFSSCLQNKARSISECSCYGKTLKVQMPKDDYHFFMEALYFSSNADKDNFDKAMEKYGKSLNDLDAMSTHVAAIGAEIELKCSPKGKFNLPKPK